MQFRPSNANKKAAKRAKRLAAEKALASRRAEAQRADPTGRTLAHSIEQAKETLPQDYRRHDDRRIDEQEAEWRKVRERMENRGLPEPPPPRIGFAPAAERFDERQIDDVRRRADANHAAGLPTMIVIDESARVERRRDVVVSGAVASVDVGANRTGEEAPRPPVETLTISPQGAPPRRRRVIGALGLMAALGAFSVGPSEPRG